MTTSEKIVENVTITALSRLAMMATPLMISIIGVLFWVYINDIRADARSAKDSVVTVENRTTVLESRTGTIEADQKQSREDRLAAQNNIIASNERVVAVVTEQGKQLAAIAATIEALKEEVRQRK